MVEVWKDYVINKVYDHSNMSGSWEEEDITIIEEWAHLFGCELFSHSSMCLFEFDGIGLNKKLSLYSGGGEATSITLTVPSGTLKVKFKKSGSDPNPVVVNVVNGRITLSANDSDTRIVYYSEVSLSCDAGGLYRWNGERYLENTSDFEIIDPSIDWNNKTYKQQNMQLFWKNYRIKDQSIGAQGFYTESWGDSNINYRDNSKNIHSFNFVSDILFVEASLDLTKFYNTDNNQWFYYYFDGTETWATLGPFYIIEIDTSKLICDARQSTNTTFYFNVQQGNAKYYFLPTKHDPNKTLREELQQITTGWTTQQLLEQKEITNSFTNTDIVVKYNLLHPKTIFDWEHSNYSYPFISNAWSLESNYITSYGETEGNRVLLRYNLGINDTITQLIESSDLSVIGHYDFLNPDGSHYSNTTAGRLFYQPFEQINVKTLSCYYPISMKNETIPNISINSYETNPGRYIFSFESLGTSYNHYFTGKKISQNGNYYNTWEKDGVYTWWYDNSNVNNRQYNFRNVVSVGNNSKLYYIFVARNIDMSND